MTDHVVISNQIEEDVLDISILKSKGIELLQEYSGKIWTDYNIHDPGVTILEVLCFAITELGFRSNYELKELIKDKRGISSSLYASEYVFSSSGITMDDLRSVILDVEGVRNVEFTKSSSEKEFEGVFDLNIQLKSNEFTAEQEHDFILLIREILEENRNIGIDFGSINICKVDEVSFDIDIEIDSNVDYGEFAHKIVSDIERYFYPVLHFYSEDELKDKGFSNDQIFNGPKLKNGFVILEELHNHHFRKVIYVSEIIGSVMKIDQVKMVKKFVLTDCNNGKHNWTYNVENGKVSSLNLNGSTISFYHKGNQIYTSKLSHVGNTNNIASSLVKKRNVLQEVITTDKEEDNLNLSLYSSIQNDFPQTYGVGDYGLPVGSNDTRLAQSRQLKSYLMVFDQLLATFFHQLDNLKNLYSLDDIETTFETKAVINVPNGEFIYLPFLESYFEKHFNLDDKVLVRKEWKNYLSEKEKELSTKIRNIYEDEYKYLERRNKILNHLIARFGFDIKSFEIFSGFDKKQLIEYKLNILRSIPLFGDRSKGFSIAKDYLSINNEIKHFGLSKIISLLTGLRNTELKSLTNVFNQYSQSNNSDNEIVSEVSFSLEGEGNDALAKVLRYGQFPEKYVVKELQESSVEFELYSDGNESVANVLMQNSGESDILVLQEKLAATLAEINLDSEGFHLVEHLLIRPGSGLNCFGFYIYDGEKIFESTNDLTRKERDFLFESFQNFCVDIEAFEIKELGLKQFKIISKVHPELMSFRFFGTYIEAENKLLDYVNFFKSIDDLNKNVRFSTCYDNVYNEIDDPFSNVMTFIFPTWPVRFQSSSFRNYIEQVIIENVPAHMITNIKWFDFHQMSLFEQTFSNYLSNYKNSSPTQQKQLLDDLLQGLIWQ